MKKIYFFFLFFPLFIFSEPFYNFQISKPLLYSFQIKGNVSFSYPGSEGEKFNVFAKGNLKIECEGKEEDIYTLKITPSKTIVKVGDTTLEDITNSETMISSLISTSRVKLKTNGKIISIEDINEGILTLTQILNLIPSFPEKVVNGKNWKQKIPAFKLPGIPMCDLEFNYLYKKGEKFSNIEIISNQIIKEEKKDRDIKIIFTGKNQSKGNFDFDENEGEINSFNGNFSIDLNIKFEMPPSPDQKTKAKETLPMKLILDLNFSLSKI